MVQPSDNIKHVWDYEAGMDSHGFNSFLTTDNFFSITLQLVYMLTLSMLMLFS